LMMKSNDGIYINLHEAAFQLFAYELGFRWYKTWFSNRI
jgi:hypothetical protein